MIDTNSLGGLAPGDYFVNPIPEYRSQFADRDRVSDFLNDPSGLLTDSQWRSFGFQSVQDYAFWAPRLCGAVCLQMILEPHVESEERSLAELTLKAESIGGYVVRNKQGIFVDKGWYYQPLIDLAAAYGCHGKVFIDATERQLCGLLLANSHVVASVNPRVIRGDTDEVDAAARGGHLVLLLGFRWVDGDLAGFFVHNPSGRERSTQENYFVPRGIFANAYAGRGFFLTPAQRVAPGDE